MTRVREIARRVSNWGRWGADDERGTVNFITPDVVCRAAACVRRGTVFSLGLLFGADGPQIGQGGRTNPVHTVTAIDGRLGADPDGPRYADDAVSMPLQCATQWDSLAHVYYDGRLYNGVPASTLGAAGATRNAIDKLARGIVSRGVLLDLARARGVERLRAGDVITPADLEAAERAAGVRAERGSPALVIVVRLRPESRADGRPGERSADFCLPPPPLARDRRRALHRARARAARASERVARARLLGGGRARHRGGDAV